MPPSFAIIAEGATDQTVIEAIVCGVFDGEGDEPVLNRIQPREERGAPGGWTLVLRSLRDGDAASALQHNDYLIVQIDTDRSQDPGYDVPWQDGGLVLTPEELAARVRERLVREMGADFAAKAGDRLIFAVAVHATECWLLPLLTPTRAKRSKIAGCLDAVNAELSRAGQPALTRSGGKVLAAYEKVARQFERRRGIEAARDGNPSLRPFVDQLERVREKLASAAHGPDGSSIDGDR